MIKKLITVLSFLVIILNSIHVNAKDNKYVEIFDPKQNKVVKVVQLNQEIQSMVTGWVMNIEGIYGKIDPATDDGYAVRIPLDPAVKVHNNCLSTIVDAVYIIIPEKEPPFYMIFENENKLTSFRFNGDIAKLSKSLDFKLNANLK